MTTTDTLPHRDPEASTEEADRASDVAETVERTASTLLAIGRLWASHGLGVGRSALETSAATLRTTANLLGELSDKFRPDEDGDERAA